MKDIQETREQIKKYAHLFEEKEYDVQILPYWYRIPLMYGTDKVKLISKPRDATISVVGKFKGSMRHMFSVYGDTFNDFIPVDKLKLKIMKKHHSRLYDITCDDYRKYLLEATRADINITELETYIFDLQGVEMLSGELMDCIETIIFLGEEKKSSHKK